MNGFTIGLAAGMAAGAWVGMRVQANRRQVKGKFRDAARKAENAFDDLTRYAGPQAGDGLSCPPPAGF